MTDQNYSTLEEMWLKNTLRTVVVGVKSFPYESGSRLSRETFESLNG